MSSFAMCSQEGMSAVQNAPVPVIPMQSQEEEEEGEEAQVTSAAVDTAQKVTEADAQKNGCCICCICCVWWWYF